MKNAQHYLVVEVTTGYVVAEVERFRTACTEQRKMQRATRRPYRIDIAGHRR